LPGDLENQKVTYLLKAGQLAIHHTMIPHNSQPNHSDHWRRVLVLRYMNVKGQMGTKEYVNYRNGQTFNRGYVLVRGQSNDRRVMKIDSLED
jgi:hypothetical protein